MLLEQLEDPPHAGVRGRLVAGTVMALPLLPWGWHDLAHASASAWGSALYLALFPSALGFVLWGYAVANLPVATSVSLLYLVPPVAVLIGFVWLGEVPHASERAPAEGRASDSKFEPWPALAPIRMRSLRAALLATTSVLCAVLPATAGAAPPDAVMSDNVEYLGSIQQDVGLTAGAKVVGDRMFVTSGKNISIYDISDPASPKPLGSMKTNIAWENEEVPTNGKVLAVASDFYSVVPECMAAMAATGCVQFFDVRDPSNIKQVGTIPVANHTAECVLNCQYFYGRAGTIIDARGILDGKAPKVVGNWIDELKAQGVTSTRCHHIREIRPGVLLTACQPFAAISVNAADGGSPEHPKVLYTGEAAKFVHSARWPRRGADRFVLTGGEQNFTGRCERNNSEFSVYSADKVLAGQGTQFEGPLAQVPPAGNGVYADGKPVAGALGCSVHWFQEHPSFRNGGLVAISEYEDGVRFLQIKPDGSITEQGYFLSLGSSSSSPKWAGKDNVLYSIDYQRGIDILRWKGRRYVPNSAGVVAAEPGLIEGTEGVTPPPAPNAEQAAQRAALAQQLGDSGWSPGLCYLAAGQT